MCWGQAATVVTAWTGDMSDVSLTPLTTVEDVLALAAELGEHDEPITYQEMANVVGNSVADRLRELSLKIYSSAERISAPLLVEDAVAEEILEIVLQRRQEGLRLLTG